jgi:TatD DNase family protein
MQTSKLNSSNFVDFHCHLDLFPNHLEILRECEELGIKTLTVTNAPRVFSKNQLFAESCKHVRVALGLHPQLAHLYLEELELFEKLLSKTRYIGEVGLDGAPEYSSTLQTQRQVFLRILKLCASAGNKVLTVHSRRAASEVVDLIGNHLPPSKGQVVLHWFTGSLKEATRAIETGCYFSVNIKMLESERRRTLIESIPYDRILTESDGPFVKANGAVMSPKNIGKVIQKLAEIWGLDEKVASEIIQSNLRALLSNPPV